MNKYGARKVHLDGHQFASTAEGLRYLLLKDRQRKGEIAGLVLQPEFDMVVNGLLVGTYTPDFGYSEKAQAVADETKGGYRQEAFRLRAKLFQACYPHIELRINGVAAKKPKPPKMKRAA